MMLGKLEEGDLLCEHCQLQLDTLDKLHLISSHDLTILRNPVRAITVHYPLIRDSGEEEIVTGFRIQYNDALGPTKGGIRIHESANLEDVTELAFLMSLKTALVGLPYGGAKGAIKIQRESLSDTEFEQVVRGYIRQVARCIGEDHDIPAPDVNTNADTMALMLDEYERIVGRSAPATFTGKPFAKGGSLGRETATSMGGFFIIQELFKDSEPQETSVAIQGFGNVGGHLASLLYDAGFCVVAVSDVSGGIYNKDGLDIPDLIKHKSDGGVLKERKEQAITNEELLELEVDILAPAALGGVIDEHNAKNVQAGAIIEMANAPVTPQAEKILEKKGTRIVPDILANAGGVIVSYFEWLQNKESEQWTAEKVNTKLKETIVPAYERVAEEHKKRPTLSMRNVAYLLAVKRIIEATADKRR